MYPSLKDAHALILPNCEDFIFQKRCEFWQPEVGRLSWLNRRQEHQGRERICDNGHLGQTEWDRIYCPAHSSCSEGSGRQRIQSPETERLQERILRSGFSRKASPWPAPWIDHNQTHFRPLSSKSIWARRNSKQLSMSNLLQNLWETSHSVSKRLIQWGDAQRIDWQRLKGRLARELLETCSLQVPFLQPLFPQPRRC